jgi:rod shape-determining protein MreD
VSSIADASAKSRHQVSIKQRRLDSKDIKPSGSDAAPEGDTVKASLVVMMAVAAFILQALLAPLISIFGVNPDFLIIDVVCIATVADRRTATANGFVCGLLGDMLGTGPVGSMALSLCVVSYVLSLLSSRTRLTGLPSWAFNVVASALVTYVLVAVILSAFGYVGSFWMSIPTFILPSAAYTSVLGMLAYPLLGRLGR